MSLVASSATGRSDSLWYSYHNDSCHFWHFLGVNAQVSVTASDALAFRNLAPSLSTCTGLHCATHHVTSPLHGSCIQQGKEEASPFFPSARLDRVQAPLLTGLKNTIFTCFSQRAIVAEINCMVISTSHWTGTSQCGPALSKGLVIVSHTAVG